jgi:repressor LexA
MDLTARRKAILEFVSSYTEARGYPPTVREIGAATGLKSTKSVKDHLDKLVQSGFLSRAGRTARSLSSPARKVPETAGIPIIGQVAAGIPMLAEQNITGWLPFPGVAGDGHFFLRVKGDSMTGAGILDGDLVLVRSQPFVQQGEIAVVLVDDEATVKRFYKRAGRIELVPENPSHRRMTFGPDSARLRIEGKVVAVLRILEDGALRPVT